MPVRKFGIAVHGGAGVMSKAALTEEQEKMYSEGIAEALERGYAMLAKKGNALDAVQAAVNALEDNPLFNAGRGAVFNHAGGHEMDASIMDGKELMAGAVCAVSHIKNPVTLAREVMLHSEHVLLTGEGAEAFAKERGITLADDDYFFSQHRYDQLQEARSRKVMQLDDGNTMKIGTVGAVALDSAGNLAAATSTGGITNKRFGRIGDSPIIGAGTYANNQTCAISCTGHGEYFIRAVVAYDVHALMLYKGLLLKEACEEVVKKKLVSMGGEGGLIAIDRFGNIEMPYNGDGMYRGMRSYNSQAFIAIHD